MHSLRTTVSSRYSSSFVTTTFFLSFSIKNKQTNKQFMDLLLTAFICTGDEFALREGGSLYCKDDHDVLEKSAQSRVAPVIESNNNTNLNNNNHSSELGSMSGKRTILEYGWFIECRADEIISLALSAAANKRLDLMLVRNANWNNQHFFFDGKKMNRMRNGIKIDMLINNEPNRCHCTFYLQSNNSD